MHPDAEGRCPQVPRTPAFRGLSYFDAGLYFLFLAVCCAAWNMDWLSGVTVSDCSRAVPPSAKSATWLATVFREDLVRDGPQAVLREHLHRGPVDVDAQRHVAAGVHGHRGGVNGGEKRVEVRHAGVAPVDVRLAGCLVVSDDGGLAAVPQHGIPDLAAEPGAKVTSIRCTSPAAAAGSTWAPAGMFRARFSV